MPEQTVTSSVEDSSRERCAKISLEVPPSGTQSAANPRRSMSAAASRTAEAGRASNAKVHTPA